MVARRESVRRPNLFNELPGDSLFQRLLRVSIHQAPGKSQGPIESHLHLREVKVYAAELLFLWRDWKGAVYRFEECASIEGHQSDCHIGVT